MTKPKIFNCPICGNNFIYTTKFLEHVQETHHLSILDQEQFYIEYFLNGVEPLCACGCGKRTKFYKLNYGFPLRFIRGHNASEQGNWKNPEIMQKAVAKRVQGFKEQKYVVWNKGLTQETNEIVAHISKQGHETLKRKYASGELISWQKGLTIDDPRIKQAVETRRANGFVPWNLGLTKETDSRLMSIAQKNSQMYDLPDAGRNEISYSGKQCYEIVQLLTTFDCHKDLLKELLFECVLQANENHKDGILISPDIRFIDDEFYLSFGFSIFESKRQLWSTDFINRYEIVSENDLEESGGVAIIYGIKNNLFFLPCVQRDSSVL